MKRYKTIKRVNLTVEPGSEVILTSASAAAAAGTLVPAAEMPQADKPLLPTGFQNFTTNQLTEFAGSIGADISGASNNAERRAIIETVIETVIEGAVNDKGKVGQ